MSKTASKKDVAVIGISCRFPMSENADEFWQNLIKGKELIHFPTDEEVKESGLHADEIDKPNFIKARSFIADSGRFDYSFFGYTKDEASCMDPQTRILHEQVWLALEDAGYDFSSYKGNVGLYVSASDNFNWIAHTRMNQNGKVNPYYMSLLANKNFASTLISYSLDLKGPSCYIDTACSSSLTSVHIACRSLLMRECSLALAGGVSIDTTKNMGYFFEEGSISSRDGHCRAFDRGSSGTVAGDGVAVVALKRLEEALADRDHIYAVIRSSAANNDGRRKVGYTAPSVTGQADCIKLAHRIAGVSPQSISYIEAHGTGTRLGDPVEIEALNKAFNYGAAHSCAIGSVKTNMGHLDAAAGVAGLVKTALALKNKRLPPSLHFNQPNPEISFDSGPFYVNRTLKKWEQKDEKPLLAGVSSFGIGGTNVHVVLEEPPVMDNGSSSRPYKALLYSAKSKSSLEEYQRKIVGFLEAGHEFDLADMAYTLKIGRAAFPYRNFVVCKDQEDALGQLKELSGGASEPFIANYKRKIVFMFPGQGSQYREMAKDIYFNEDFFKSIMDQGFRILKGLTGKDYAEIIGYKNSEDIDQALIDNTEHTQPLLFLFEYALARLLMKWRILPDYMIGHSLGEYVAACISEVFSFEDALAIIVKRAKLMSKIEEGDMVGIGETAENIKPVLRNGLSLAAINTKNSCVVSGNKRIMDKFTQVLSSKNIPYTYLKTSHAFHSEMMESILDAYEKELGKISFSRPKFPFVSNLTGKEITSEEAISPGYWAQHVRETVNFAGGIDSLLQKGDAVLIEVGPGKTLSTFCRQNKKNADNALVIGLLRHPKEKLNDHEILTKALSRLWCSGVEIDWVEYYSSEKRNKMSAPLYRFDKHLFESNVDPLKQLTEKGLNLYKTNSKEWFYTPLWKRSFLSRKGEYLEGMQNYLIFSEGEAWISTLKDHLEGEGNSVFIVEKGKRFIKNSEFSYAIDPNSEEEFALLFRELDNRQIAFQQIVFNWNFVGETPDELMPACLTYLYLCKRLTESHEAENKKITFISEYNYPVLGHEKVNLPLTTALTLAGICAQENPGLFSCCIDVGGELKSHSLISKVVNELKFNLESLNVAYRNNERWVEFYDLIDPDTFYRNKFLQKGNVYVITGGLGNIGTILTAHLCDTYRAKVIIVGKTRLHSPEFPERFLEDGDEVGLKIKTIRNHREKKRDVFYNNADVSDYNELLDAIKSIEKEHGKISGVIHAAGNLDKQMFKPIEDTNEEIIKKQFAPKVEGTFNLYRIFRDRNPDFVWITSSLSSIVGGLTYGAYATANKFIDAFVRNKKDELKNWICVNLAGISEDAISPRQLTQVFERSLDAAILTQVIVSPEKISAEGKKKNFKVHKSNLVPDETFTDRPLLMIGYAPPRTKIEKELCDLWQSFFGYEKIGIHDDFFELGGDSLKAMTLAKRIQKQYNLEINLRVFYSKPTIKDISEEIELALELMTIQKQDKGKTVIKI